MAQKTKSIPLTFGKNPDGTDVGPHNGTPKYQVRLYWKDWDMTVPGTEEDHEYVETLGGQKLLIRKALEFKRFIAPVGRRFGKSTSIPWLFIEEARNQPGVYYALYIAQSHDKAYEMREFCVAMWGGEDSPMIKKIVGGPKEQLRYIETVNIHQAEEMGPNVNKGMRIYYVSGAHPHYEKIRGYMHPIHRIVQDETAIIHPNIRKTISSMLADDDGSMLCIGTTDEDQPGNDQFALYYDRGLSEEPKFKRWGCMNFPMFANPHLSEEGMQEVLNDCVTQDDIDQEVYAKFLRGKGSVFGNLEQILVLKPAVCDDDEERWPSWLHQAAADAIRARGKAEDSADQPPSVWIYSDYQPTHTYIMSTDWAKSSDHTVTGVYDMTTLEQVCLIQFHGENWTEQFVWNKAIREKYDAQEATGDENTGAGEAMGDMMRSEYETGTLVVKFNTFSKPKFVRNGQIIFYEGRIKLIRCAAQFNEFKIYKKFKPNTEKGEVRVRYGHPDGKHDDFVDSFLQITEAILDGQRDEEREAKKKGYTMIDQDGCIDYAAFGEIDLEADGDVGELVKALR